MTDIIRMFTQLIARTDPTPRDACMQSTSLARKSSGRRRLEKPRRFNLLPTPEATLLLRRLDACLLRRLLERKMRFSSSEFEA